MGIIFKNQKLKTTKQKQSKRADEVAQWIKELAIKIDDLSLTLGLTQQERIDFM